MKNGFKGAPDFKQWPDPVNGIWKIELLRWLGKIAKIDILVETGTCEGVTPWNLQNDFKEIHTVELHTRLFQEAKKRLEGIPNVYQYFGSSKNVLPAMITNAALGPILFWLDAHSSGPHTADDGDQLPYEIDIITRSCPDALIVIDDMMGLSQFVGQVGAALPSNWHAEYRTGEIILHKAGQYDIPQFEE